MSEPMDVGAVLRSTFSNQEITFSASRSSEPGPWCGTELTDNELADAVNEAKREKYFRELQRREAEEYRRREQKWFGEWTPNDMVEMLPGWSTALGFSSNGGNDGKKVFEIDDDNASLIHALCYYFTGDAGFEKMCSTDKNGNVVRHNWRLDKGLLICGAVGVGKTTIMKLFRINKRQCYIVKKALDISREFAAKDDEGGYRIIKAHEGPLTNIFQPKHRSNLNTEYWGLCIDDIGTEQEKMNFGNRSNVIEEIILGRYDCPGLPFFWTHITTNLSAKGVEDKYGARAWSRMIEMFNIIQLPGKDRRKRDASAGLRKIVN